MSAAMPTHTAETRPLPLRRRVDLDCREQHIGGTKYWHVKDPVSLRYYQLRPEEHAVLMMLDGETSLRNIRRRFEQQFAPQRLSLSQLQSFLAMLHGSGLIVSDSPGQAAYLIEKQRATQKQQFIGRFMNLLAIRFRGYDPQRLLNWLHPMTRFLFAPWCVTLCFGLMLGALLLAGLQFDTLQSRLPRFHEFFSLSNLIWLTVIFAVTKILHELGHAVSCRHYGAECHEMGVMLLAMTPVLYCNVSDAWMMPNRWHRIMVSAAGMYIELLLASVCLFLWWFSLPGFFNSLCLNVVVVCSITTLLFNGNPLLRYDGYYIFSDFVEIPNLRQQATELTRNLLGAFFFDSRGGNPRLLPERRRVLMVVWYIAALIYRLVVVWGILWFVHALLEPYGLQPLVVYFALTTIGAMLIGPIMQIRARLSSPFWSRTVNWPHFRFRLLLVAGGLAALVMIPLPFSVKAPAVIQAEGARSVYVSQSGTLVEAASPGKEVGPDDIIGRLENPQLEFDLTRLQSEIDLLEQELDNLEDRRLNDPAVAALIPTTQQRLKEKLNEKKQKESDVERLTLRAPMNGVVLPPRPRRDPEEMASREDLPQWSGSPLDQDNLGATLRTGTEFCQVGQSDQFEAIVAVDQNDVEFIEEGQRVELLLDHLSQRVLEGTIVEIAEIDIEVAPPELVAHEDFPTTVDSDGTPRPVSAAYQVRVQLEDSGDLLVLRGTGRSRIESAPRSIADRTLAFLSRTFRFK